MLRQGKEDKGDLKKMIKNIRDLSTRKKVAFIICTLTMLLFDFFYINWISYRMALSHFESEFYIPLCMSIWAAMVLGVIKIIEMKRHKKLFIKYLVIIFLLGSVLAFIFCGYCPACNEVHNPVYRFLYKIFTGSEYIYAW